MRLLPFSIILFVYPYNNRLAHFKWIVVSSGTISLKLFFFKCVLAYFCLYISLCTYKLADLELGRILIVFFFFFFFTSLILMLGKTKTQRYRITFQGHIASFRRCWRPTFSSMSSLLHIIKKKIILFQTSTLKQTSFLVFLPVLKLYNVDWPSHDQWIIFLVTQKYEFLSSWW